MASQFPGSPPPPPLTPPPSPAGNGMVGRIQRLLTTPAIEWQRIAAEPMTVRGIMTGWAAPLAAIGPIAGLIGMQAMGIRVFGIVYRPPLASSITTAVIQYVSALAGVYALALIIDALAPSFGATKNPVQAMKVAAYSSTAAWLAGIFQIIPMLGVLGLVGLYSFYLLWVGLPLLMRPPADKAATYTIVSIIVAVVVYIVIGVVVAALSSAFVTAPGIGTVSTVG